MSDETEYYEPIDHTVYPVDPDARPERDPQLEARRLSELPILEHRGITVDEWIAQARGLLGALAQNAERENERLRGLLLRVSAYTTLGLREEIRQALRQEGE